MGKLDLVGIIRINQESHQERGGIEVKVKDYYFHFNGLGLQKLKVIVQSLM